jgi:16S rRNA G966 N2-methylase RsmD
LRDAVFQVEFPYKRLFIEDVQSLYHNLKHNRYIEWSRVYVNDCYLYPGGCGTIEFKAMGGGYEACDILADFFTEHIRIKSRAGSQWTSFEIWRWYRDHKLSQLIDAAQKIETCNPICALREGLFNLNPRECTQFKSSLAKAIYQFFASELNIKSSELSLLDPCSGWGDRLIAALSLDVKKYVCVDPNPLLREPYDHILKVLMSSATAIFHNQTFETFESDDKFDLIFTSPPFGAYEQYFTGVENDQQQCNVRYTDDWARDWLFPFAEKMMHFTKRGGYVALHLSDSGRSACNCQALIAHLNELGFPLHGTMTYYRRHSAPIPIWVWKNC